MERKSTRSQLSLLVVRGSIHFHAIRRPPCVCSLDCCWATTLSNCVYLFTVTFYCHLKADCYDVRITMGHLFHSDPTIRLLSLASCRQAMMTYSLEVALGFEIRNHCLGCFGSEAESVSPNLLALSTFMSLSNIVLFFRHVKAYWRCCRSTD